MPDGVSKHLVTHSTTSTEKLWRRRADIQPSFLKQTEFLNQLCLYITVVEHSLPLKK